MTRLRTGRRKKTRRAAPGIELGAKWGSIEALSKDERPAFGVWPLLALDDPAVEARVVDGDLDEEWETIKLPL